MSTLQRNNVRNSGNNTRTICCGMSRRQVHFCQLFNQAIPLKSSNTAYGQYVYKAVQ